MKNVVITRYHFSLPGCHFSLFDLKGEVTSPYFLGLAWPLIRWLSNSFSPYKSIRDQIWPCCKIGQGQPRVIIWTNYDGPEFPMLHTSPKVIGPLVLEKKIFEGFLPYMGMVAILVMWPRPMNKFVFPHPTDPPYEIAFDRPSGFGEDIWKWWTTDGQTTDHGYTVSSPMSLKAQVS